MTKGQFAALTAALGLATMAGTGYIAYANSGSHGSGGGNGASSGSQAGAGSQPSSGATGYGAGSTATSDPKQGGSSGSGGDSGSNSAPPCGNADIQVTTSDNEGATGHISLLLVFTNNSGHDCVMHGYPGAALQAQNGTDAGDAVRKLSGFSGGAVGLSAPPLVLLHSNAAASAVLEWSDVPTASGCAVQDPVALDVTPPNTTQTTTIPLPAQTDVCGGFQVHPVLAGIKRVP
jgi:hypothetical protein